MMTSTITILRPNLTREAALRTLQARGPMGLIRRWARGPLRRLADVYVPFCLFRVEIDSGGRTQTRCFAFDSAFGVLDPYEFSRVSGDFETVTVRTRNALPATLDETAAAQNLTDKVRRLLYSQGFFRLRGMTIRVESSGETVHIPYWVGFYGSGQRASLCVLDAVRRRTEGEKIRDALTRWLSSS
jgi:hypothetical protein